MIYMLVVLCQVAVFAVKGPRNHRSEQQQQELTAPLIKTKAFLVVHWCSENILLLSIIFITCFSLFVLKYFVIKKELFPAKIILKESRTLVPPRTVLRPIIA